VDYSSGVMACSTTASDSISDVALTIRPYGTHNQTNYDMANDSTTFDLTASIYIPS